MKKNIYITLLLIILTFQTGCPLRQIIHVTTDYATIQEAINAARNGALILIEDGIYTGRGNKNLHWNGSLKHIYIKSRNGARHCIIDCEWEGRGFVLTEGQNRNDILAGLTIQHGWIKNPTGIVLGGGAILCDSTSPQIINCILRHNIAGDSVASTHHSYWTDGGAIECVNKSNPLIKENIIENNFASHTGGGIHFSNSTGKVDNNIIRKNVNRGCYGGGGIALLLGSNPEIVNNLIINNTAQFYENGGYGGGIICMNSDPAIVNNTIISNSTITSSSDGEGGGLRIRGTPYPIIANCILRENQSGSGLENIDFQYPTQRLNIKYSNLEGGIGSILTDYAATIMDLDPIFLCPFSEDYRLHQHSPCINRGTPTLSGLPSRTTDLEGKPRISGSTIDMGAYEFQE